MDLIEQRVSALEVLFVAIGPWLDPQILTDAEADIRTGLGALSDPDERAIRLQAIELIQDARRGFKGLMPGVTIRSP